MVDIAAVAEKVAPNIKDNYREALRLGTSLFDGVGITTPIRIAHFLAQVLHETGGGTVLYENLSYSTQDRLLQIFGVGHHSAAITAAEAPGLLRNPQALAERVYGLGNPPKAKELGNTRSGDGYRYRGSGLLQTTGGANFRRMGDKSGVDFYGSPEVIVDPDHALKPAIHEWDEGGLNAYADKNDIRTITKRINGGYNGIDDRQKWFDRIWAIVHDDPGQPAWQACDEDEDTGWLQRSLNTLGYTPPLVTDGRYGPATTKAVKWFQQQAGLTVDGIAGDLTNAAIRERLSVPA